MSGDDTKNPEDVSPSEPVVEIPAEPNPPFVEDEKESLPTIAEEPPEIPEVDDEEVPIVPLESEPINMQEAQQKIDIASLQHDVESCKLKRDIITGIKKLYPDRHSDRVLQRMKKSELKELLTELFEEKCRETLVGPELPPPPNRKPQNLSNYGEMAP